MFGIWSQGHVTWQYLVSGYGKFDVNAQTFWQNGSNSIKVTFLNSFHQNLWNDIYFVWFRQDPHFPTVFHCFLVMTSLWCHFLSHGFQICIFCGTLDRLSACKISTLQIVFRKFHRQIKKNTMLTSSWRNFMLLGFENLKFCKSEYRLSLLQVSNLLVVWIEFYGS